VTVEDALAGFPSQARRGVAREASIGGLLPLLGRRAARRERMLLQIALALHMAMAEPRRRLG